MPYNGETSPFVLTAIFIFISVNMMTSKTNSDWMLYASQMATLMAVLDQWKLLLNVDLLMKF